MTPSPHRFHIPVMGTGHSADSPIRVGHLGISSVISLVDDILLYRLSKHYREEYGLPVFKVSANEPDARAKRITAYLDTVHEIVETRFESTRNQSFFEDNEKRHYFELLPDDCELKQDYLRLLAMDDGPERIALAKDLTDRMSPGSIDVNIMVKLDRRHTNGHGQPLGPEFSDAKAALRGFANSRPQSALVLSAGINRDLIKLMAVLPNFYRNEEGVIEKKLILKVSDFRSAMLQGKVLAQLGLEVAEYRIESGLNCGGHAFPTKGVLMPAALKEFQEKRSQLTTSLQPAVKKFYDKKGWNFPESALEARPLLSVQGGIGNHGEAQRMYRDFDADLTGWGTPFLLVPEATCVDHSTLESLKDAGDDELYVSHASPLGIPFNNLRTSGSELCTQEQNERGEPGSKCSKHFLISNTEFTEEPICASSQQYQKLKLEEIEKMDVADEEKQRLRTGVTEKSCICDHLGNGALISLGLAEAEDAPQAICPGPNLAWFNRTYTLKEMVDHIYGRGECFVPEDRPHMFAKEIEMYVDQYIEQSGCCHSPAEVKALKQYRTNLEEGMELCLTIAQGEALPGENLDSIPPCVAKQKTRIEQADAVTTT